MLFFNINIKLILIFFLILVHLVILEFSLVIFPEKYLQLKLKVKKKSLYA